MFQTTQPDPDWLERLRQRQFTADTVHSDPAMETLKRKLLTHGGHAVVLAHPEPHMKEIMEQGKIQSGEALLRPMEKSGCHRNVAKFYRNNPTHAKIMTGWALSDDGLWRQHSWLKTKATSMHDAHLIETTTKRTAYFGFELSDEEAKTFG